MKHPDSAIKSNNPKNMGVSSLHIGKNLKKSLVG